MDDGALEALYGQPLDRFIAERDLIVASLRDAGDREGAAAVKALAKPSVPAWAVNQLVRREREAIDELVAIGGRLRAAHQAVLDGGSSEELLRVRGEEQRAVAGLLDAADALLADAGFAPNATRRERIADTLSAMAADAATASVVRAGRLTKELQRIGFGETATPAPVTARSTQPPAESAVASEAQVRERARASTAEAERTRAHADRLAAAADLVERDARRARAEANEARRDAERAERAAHEAARAEREAEGRG